MVILSHPAMDTLITIVTYFLPVTTWSFFVFAAGTWFFVVREKHQKYFRGLVAALVGLRFLYAVLATFGQYRIWASDPKLAPVFLKADYFPHYVLTHFWLNFGLTLVFTWILWLFLERLKKHRERFFEEGETMLGALCALVVGWPLQPVYLASVFVAVVLISIFRSIVFREPYTTLGAPFLFGTLICLLFGVFLLHNAGWDVLKI